MAKKTADVPPEDHACLHRVQGAQLHHQEPSQRPRSPRAEEVLPEVPQPHLAPRGPLTHDDEPPARITGAGGFRHVPLPL